LIRLVLVTAVTLLLLLNDECKLESLQKDGSRTRQEIPQTACYKAKACNCCTETHDPVEIANEFTSFFIEVGERMSSNIPPISDP